MSKSLNYRKDVRTEEEFKENIIASTKREQRLMELWVKEMRFRGHIVSYEHYGIDNSGQFIEKTDCRPDYKVLVDGKEMLLEVKCNKYSFKNTFKVFDLKMYINYYANILLFYGIGDSDLYVDYDTTRWTIIARDKIEEMLQNNKVKNGGKLWGFKDVIIIYEKEYNKYWQEERLTHIHINTMI